MKLRHTLRLLAAFSLTAPAAAQPAPTAPSEPTTPPNIVFVFADDLGYFELGAYGQTKIKTPHIDRLAAEGLRFTRFYSASTVCAPARTSIMTGLHTGFSPIRGNRENGGWGPEAPEGQMPLPDHFVTLPERLRESGYATALFGKWGLGGPGSEGHPNHQGFDHFYGYLCQRVAHNFYPTHLWRNHDVDVQLHNRHFPAHQRLQVPLESEDAYFQRFGGTAPGEGGLGGDFSAESIIAEAEAWIASTHADDPDKPIFIYYPTTIPHVALQAPREWVERYPREWDLPHDQTDDPTPDTDPATGHYLGTRGYTPHPRPRAAYAAMISYFDDSVGRLLAALDQAGRLDNTLVVVTSDNGTTFNGGVDRAFFNSLGDLRGYKTNLYEGGIKVPCIAWWPGRIPAGTTTDAVAQLPDWHATLATIGAAGTPTTLTPVPPTALDLTELLRNPAATPEPLASRAVLYWEFPEGRQQQAVLLDQRWKAIRPNLKDHPERLELYDLVNDPNETTDLTPDRPDLVQRALETMAAHRTPNADFPMPALDP